MPTPIATVPGHRYGRLVAIAFVEKDRHNNHRWKFLCDCGNEHIAYAGNVRAGKIQSCGCINIEVARQTAIKHKTTHGQSGTPEFGVWCSMRRRCTDIGDKRYADYGGRGIKVCDRWQTFQNFLDDMGERPTPNHSIEREGNDGDYEPGNCRWATDGEQRRNKRTTRFVTYLGKKMPLVDACEAAGIRYGTVNARLNRLGWSEERALSKP